MESPLKWLVPGNTSRLTRRTFLNRALASGGMAASAAVLPQSMFAQEPATAPLALSLARSLNRIRFGDLPPAAIMHAKMILASTLASAAPGSLIGSARIVRELAKEQGGRPEATVWFDGTKLPLPEVARSMLCVVMLPPRMTAISAMWRTPAPHSPQ
jgi:hypothetical protein